MFKTIFFIESIKLMSINKGQMLVTKCMFCLRFFKSDFLVLSVIVKE